MHKNNIIMKEDNTNKILEILKNLIQINKGFEEKNIVNKDDYLHIETLLKENNFKVSFINSNPNHATSMMAIYSSNNTNLKQIDLAFLGHVDVVDPGDWKKWHNNPFQIHRNQDILYARGMVDMKASIATFILATIHFIKKNPNKYFILAIFLVGDEEKNSLSTIDLVNYLKINNFLIKQTIIGEPTSEHQLGDVIKNGRRGSANFDLEIFGTQGHVAYPHLANNPIKKIDTIINNLNNIKFNDQNEFFDESHLEITSIQTFPNKVRNVIPEKIEISFNIRYNNNQNIDSLKQIIHQACKEINNYNLLVYSYFDPFICKKNKFSNILSKSIQNITGIKTQYKTNGGTSDGRFFHEISSGLIEFGPLNKSAHKINEYISLKDLNNLYKIYYDCLENYFLKEK